MARYERDAGGLATVHSGLMLPVAGGDPGAGTVSGAVVGAVAGGRLHLFAEARHLAVDREGAVVVPPAGTGLPPVRSLTAAGDALLVTCAGHRDGRPVPVLARVALDGTVTARTELPVSGTLTQWPKVAATNAATWYAWTTTNATGGQAGDPKRVGERWWVTGWPQVAGGGGVAPVELGPLDGGGADGTVELAVAANGDRVLVAGLVGGVGRGGRIVVRVLGGGREVAAGEVPDTGNPVFVRAYAGPHGWWLVWKERVGGVLLARRLRYGAALGAAGAWDPPLRLYRTRPPDRVHDAHLVVERRAGLVALLVRVAAAGGRGGNRFRDQVALLLPRDGSLAGYRELSEPGTGYSAGGWVEGRLVLVHGADRPLVTVLAPATGLSR